jgi:ferredoxin
MVFSIIMHTDFVSFPRIESGKSMNSRMETLLKTFGLEGREYSSITGENIFNIDFTYSESILSEKRAEAFKFLENAFTSGIKEEKAPISKTSVLENKWDCCGCTACSNACPVKCITMARDSEGFSYPSIDLEKCIHCKKCENVCPSVNKTSPLKTVGERCMIAYSKMPDIRKSSSSGGIFYHLAERVIADGGTVFGVCLENGKVKHSYAQTTDELKKFQGSKYVQSEIGDCYVKAKEFLDDGKLVYFSGTPCQIKGLYAFLGDKIYPSLITQDLICHGVPSPKVFEEYLAFHSHSDKPSVSFRDKKYGWHYFSMKISDEKHLYRKTLEEDWYLKLFLDNTILRPSCYACKAKEEGSSADITLADCWLHHKICSEIKDTNEGLSLVLLNSKTGQLFWDKAVSSDNIFFKIVDSDKAIASQSIISNSVKPNAKRAIFFDALNKVNIEYLYKNWYKNSIVSKIKRNINFLTICFLMSMKRLLPVSSYLSYGHRNTQNTTLSIYIAVVLSSRSPFMNGVLSIV